MRACLWALMVVLLTVGVGCATAAAVAPTMTPGSSSFPATTDIPSCAGLKRLDRAIKFEWPGEDVLSSVEPQSWSYYSCSQTATTVAAFYRDEMKKPPYSWLEMGWVEREEGTLGTYFHTGYQRWLYTWFLPDKANARAANLVLMWREADWPVDLPCCGPEN